MLTNKPIKIKTCYKQYKINKLPRTTSEVS